MKTDELINALAADRAPPGVRQSHIWLVAGVAGVLVAGLVFFTGIGPRPDIAAAAATLRFLFKFVATLPEPSLRRATGRTSDAARRRNSA